MTAEKTYEGSGNRHRRHARQSAGVRTKGSQTLRFWSGADAETDGAESAQACGRMEIRRRLNWVSRPGVKEPADYRTVESGKRLDRIQFRSRFQVSGEGRE